MLLISILLSASVQGAPAPRLETVTARPRAVATVRILRSASLRVGGSHTLEGKPLRDTRVRSAEGKLVPARLAEFE